MILHSTYEHGISSASIDRLRASLRAWLVGLEQAQFTYLDEGYLMIAEMAQALRETGSVPFTGFSSRTLLASTPYRDLVSRIYDLAEADYATIPELYELAQRLADAMTTGAQSLGAGTRATAALIREADASARKRAGNASVLDELLLYSTLAGSVFQDGELAHDERAGTVTLPVSDERTVGFTIARVLCSIGEGGLVRDVFDVDSIECLRDGYFSSRVFGEIPRIAPDQVINTDSLADGSLESGLYLERNSLSPADGFSLTLFIEPDEECNVLELVADPGMEGSLPVVAQVRTGAATTTDHTLALQDNRIVVREMTLGELERGFLPPYREAFPAAVYPVAITGTLEVAIATGTPELASFPERVALSPIGTITRRFNFLETAALGEDYDPDYLVPASLYSRMELSEMRGIVASADSVRDERVSLYRHALGLREILLRNRTYATSGQSTTNNLNTTGRRIAAVDLFVSDTVPTGTSIVYQISPDLGTWYTLSPVNRQSSTYTRAVFTGFEGTSADLAVAAEATQLFLRVQMTGSGSVTPVLKAYAVRIKYL